jgi:hypothetical protein
MYPRARAHVLRPGPDLLEFAQLRGLAVEQVAEPEPERELQLATAAPDSERRTTVARAVALSGNRARITAASETRPAPRRC